VPRCRALFRPFLLPRTFAPDSAGTARLFLPAELHCSQPRKPAGTAGRTSPWQRERERESALPVLLPHFGINFIFYTFFFPDTFNLRIERLDLRRVAPSSPRASLSASYLCVPDHDLRCEMTSMDRE